MSSFSSNELESWSDIIKLYQRRHCPVHVWGVALGHQEVVLRWSTVQGSAEAQWSKNWGIVDQELENLEG
jgi:hypothetical protein